ncbi:MAG: DUF2288 domain-containing protein [Gallionellaceae bacterium]|jgi:hypothetical protein
METEQQKLLRSKVNMETSRIAWKELQRFFASGAAVEVSTTLDLIEVAMQMHADNKEQFTQWLASGLLAKVADRQAAAWLVADAEVWAVVVSPWVLIQEIRETPVH